MVGVLIVNAWRVCRRNSKCGGTDRRKTGRGKNNRIISWRLELDEFSDKVQTAYEELDDGDGVLVFVDIFGGSPSNAVMKLISQKPEVKAIAGLNMPMLVEAFFNKRR